MEDDRRYRRLYEAIPEAFAGVDMEGRFLEANAAYLRMVGYTEEELRGMRFLDLTPERWHDFERRILESQVLEKGSSELYRKELRRRDGTVFPVELRTVLLRDAAGRPEALWAAVRDISEREREEDETLASRFFLESIIDQSPTPTWISDAEGTLIRINKANLDLLRMREEEVLGKYNIHQDNLVEAQGLMPLIRRVYEEGQSVSFRIVWDSAGLRNLRFREHAPVVLRTSVFPIIDTSGRVTNAVYQHLDVTRLTQAELENSRLESQLLQAQKMESIGRLAGGIAHDFNNMLGVIHGYAGLMAERLPAADPLRPYVEEIRKAAERSADITRQLLAFSRKQVIAPRVFDLNSLIADLRSALARLIGEDVDLRIAADPAPCRILADPSQLNQVLFNMAANARDAMPGGGTLAIATSHAAVDGAFRRRQEGTRPGPHVLLEVRDDGVGMDAETLAHLFEPFYTTKEAGRGTGLGLATVYGIVKQNRGWIDVESAPGSGSVFRIYLPAASQESGEVEPEAGGPPAAAAHGETILLVEDDEMVRSTTQALLESLGYRVLPTGTPREAVGICGEPDRALDLLLTDVVMPEMTGVELRDRVAGIRPGLPVLFMSGYTADVVAHHGILDSGVDLLQKPFDLPTLGRRVREALQRARPR